MDHEIAYKNSHSLVISWLSQFIEWGNRNLTLARWIFKNSDKQIFIKLEAMMIIVTILCLVIVIAVPYLPYWVSILFSILLVQRVVEFFIVYTRNFVFNRGRIFSLFTDPQQRGEWLIVVFGINVIQLILIFATWYQTISLGNPDAFSSQLNVINSIYFSFTTFITVGYGDFYPVSVLAKLVVMSQMILFFYTLVIVVNGLISIHFNKQTS